MNGYGFFGNVRILLVICVFVQLFLCGCGGYKPPESVLDKIIEPPEYTYKKEWEGKDGAEDLFNEADSILKSGADKENLKKALSLLMKAGKAGNLKAITALASLNKTGYGDKFKKNLENCVKLYKIAAEKGYPIAQHDLGLRFFKGEGVQKDDKKAFEWYLKSANNGLVLGFIKVAQCYEHGIGVEVDMKKAIEFYYWAALKNSGQGQYNLSILVGSGKGYPVSKLDSHKWAYIAAKNGYPKAEEMVQMNREMLTAEEKECFEKIAQEWWDKNKN